MRLRSLHAPLPLLVIPPTLSLPKLPPILSQRLTSPTNLPSYSRTLSTPAFAVTTPWGSPYMIFERLSRSENAEEDAVDATFKSVKDLAKDLETPGETTPEGDDDGADDDTQRTRTTALYFTDPDDALGLRDEMKQMGPGMATADVRVMSTSLGRALRQSSVLGRGLPTGQSLDDSTGRLVDGMLRYKLVPSRRELFYAGRCVGKERVGLFGDSAEDDAREVLMDDASKQKERRRRDMMERARRGGRRGGAGEESALRVEYKMRRGKTGVPLFYVDGLRGKGVNGKEEIPLFFSYEDLMKRWREMKLGKARNDGNVPAKPPTVEVFNFVDVVTALDREQWKIMPRRKNLVDMLMGKKKQSLAVTDTDENEMNSLDIQKVVFVPSSRSLAFKENTTANGNRKARLRPMR